MKIQFYTTVWRHNVFLLCKTTLLSVSLLSNILHFTLLSNYVPNVFAVNSKYQQRAVSRVRPAVILLILLTEVRMGRRYAARWHHATGFWVRWLLCFSTKDFYTHRCSFSVWNAVYKLLQADFTSVNFDSNFLHLRSILSSLAWSVYRFSRLKISCFFSVLPYI